MTEFKAPPPPPETFNVPLHPGEGATTTEQPLENKVEQQPAAPEPVKPAEEVAAAPEPVHEQAEAEHVAPSPEKQEEKPVLEETQSQPDTKVSPIKELLNRLNPTQRQGVIAIVAVVFGIILGAVMFGGSGGDPTPVVQGLQGIVSNPDIKTPLKRCGQVEASAACVLYIMNSLPYEKLAKDFFEAATAVTGRSTTIIGWDNVRYGGLKIPPGYFAQIKIPARQ